MPKSSHTAASAEIATQGAKTTQHQAPWSVDFLAPKDFQKVYRAGPVVRVRVIKKGVPAKAVPALAGHLHWTNEALASWLGLGHSTIKRKIRDEGVLSTDEGERVLGLARLVGQVEALVSESGEPDGFDAAAWVSQWLATPNAALDGERPAEYLDTAEGQSIVSGLLAQMQSGAYA
jgi:putative toxin-antitoxin system antitoxin component (TIGR02293 family)